MVTYIGQSQAKDGESENLREFLASVVLPAISASQGCMACQLLQKDDDANGFIVIEVWTSIEAHRASVKSIPAEKIQEFMNLVAGPPTGSYYSVLESFDNTGETAGDP